MSHGNRCTPSRRSRRNDEYRIAKLDIETRGALRDPLESSRPDRSPGRWLIALACAALFACAVLHATAAPPSFTEQDGRVIMEAEAFTGRLAAPPHEWLIVPLETAPVPVPFVNFRGEGYVQLQPDGIVGGGPLVPPSLEYSVHIDTPGPWRLYVRWAAPGNSSDTFYAGIAELRDGPGGAIADWYRFVRMSSETDFAAGPTWFGSGGFERTDSPSSNGEQPVVWQIPAAGDYTLRIDMREDGVSLDALVLQQAALPAPSGLGPFPEEPPDDPVIVTRLQALRLGQPVATTFQAGGGTPPFDWTVAAGSLPPGLGLAPDGTLAGSPFETGTFEFTVRVTDDRGAVAERDYAVEVAFILPPPALRVSKTITDLVPGGTAVAYAVVENAGNETLTDVRLVEAIEPWFDLLDADPAPAAVAGAVDPFPGGDGGAAGAGTYTAWAEWTVDALEPGAWRLLSYRARLDGSFPHGMRTAGALCVAGGEPAPGDDPAAAAGDPGACRAGREACQAQAASACPAGHAKCLVAELRRCTRQFARCHGGCERALAVAGPRAHPAQKRVVARRFVRPDQVLVYPIHVENPTRLEASELTVRDRLDAGLDLATVELHPAAAAMLDEPSRTVTWTLAAPGTGFAPGEAVELWVAARPEGGLPSGTALHNRARVLFETFDARMTNTVRSVVDDTPPACEVAPLPARAQQPPFTVRWRGRDPVGRIAGYTIYVSVDEGPWTPWLTEVRRRRAQFTGEDGRRYGFLCVAVDTVGNVEPQRLQAEATTRVEPADHPAQPAKPRYKQ